MADFNAAHKIVMANEGGYANDPEDRGGETYKGIARKKHPAWPGWIIIDQMLRNVSLDIAGINKLLATNTTLQSAILEFYKTEFWDELNLDQVSNQAIAIELYDTGVNAGTGLSALFLQRALNVSNRNEADYPDLKLDGKIGPNTISVLNHHKDQVNVLKVLNVLQGGKYISIMEANPSQEKFFRSWFSRVAI